MKLNLEPRLIQICRIRWWFPFVFLFWIRNTLFWVNLSKIVCLTWNFVPRPFWKRKIRWRYSVLGLFCKLCPKNPFGILLPDSPSSLLAETWSQWLLLLRLKILMSYVKCIILDVKWNTRLLLPLTLNAQYMNCF